MQPYQNFQMNTPQFQNQMYMPSQVMQQPYMDRLQQLQAMQQSLQPQQQIFGLNGKVVDTIESIMANDVPMDGTFAVFPKRDMSEVYIKYWTGDGKIATCVFKPVEEGKAESLVQATESLKVDLSNEATEMILKRFDEIESRFDKLEKAIKPSANRKKEVGGDE